MNGGKVIFQFDADDKDLDKKTSGLASKFSSVGKTIGSGILKGTTIAATGLTALVGASVNAAGDIEQQLGGTEAVFGDFAKNIQDSAKTASSVAGLSANDYMSYANKIGSLMKGSGIEISQATDLTTQAMTRAADVASIMGIDVGSAMEAITGAAKGNFTMMDNLGVAMNATNLEAYAMSKGIKKSYTSMTQAEKVGLAYQMFLEKTADYTGNYEKENATFAGSLNTLKASFSNFLAGVGDMDEVIQNVVSFGTILVQKITEMTPQIVNGILALVNGIIPQIPTILQTMLPSIVQGAVSLMTGLVSALPSIIQTLAPMVPTILQALIQGTIQIVNSLAEQMPVLIPIIVQAVLDGILTLLDNIDLLIECGYQLLFGIIEGIIKSVPILVQKAPEIISKFVTGIISAYGKVLEAGKKFLNFLWNGITSVASSITNKVKELGGKLITALSNGLSKVKDAGKNLVTGLWNGINDKVSWVTDKIKGFGDKVIKSIKGIFGIHSPSKVMFEVGGYLDQGFINGVEDMEGEVNKAFNGVFGLSPSLYGSTSNNLSPNISVVVNSNMTTDPLGQVVNDIKTFSGGSKNDYNYGGFGG